MQVEGTFDYDHELVLLNQTRSEMPGVMLATPLLTGDNRAVLVVRGWVPYAGTGLDELTEYRETADAPIVGILQESQNMPWRQAGAGARDAADRVALPEYSCHPGTDALRVAAHACPADAGGRRAMDAFPCARNRPNCWIASPRKPCT